MYHLPPPPPTPILASVMFCSHARERVHPRVQAHRGDAGALCAMPWSPHVGDSPHPSDAAAWAPVADAARSRRSAGSAGAGGGGGGGSGGGGGAVSLDARCGRIWCRRSSGLPLFAPAPEANDAGGNESENLRDRGPIKYDALC